MLIDAGPGGSPDGFRVDVDGNLWCGWGMGSTELDGVRIFNPEGKPIGHIDLPERCANVCFGGRYRNRLFMAASHSLYALYVNTQGVARRLILQNNARRRFAVRLVAAGRQRGLSTVGGVGMWGVVVVFPAVQAEFGITRADVSFSYTTTMLGFGAGSILLGRLIDRRGAFVTMLLATMLPGRRLSRWPRSRPR